MTSICLWLYYFQIKSNKTVMPKVQKTVTDKSGIACLTLSGLSISVD